MRKTRNSINTTIWSNLLYLYSMFTRELGRQEMGDEIEVFFFLVSVIIIKINGRLKPAALISINIYF
jgi:hypothetical protein